MTITIGWKTGLLLAFLALGVAIWIAWSIQQARDIDRMYAENERLIETYQDELDEAARYAAAERAKADHAQKREGLLMISYHKLEDQYAVQKKKPRTVKNLTKQAATCDTMLSLCNDRLKLKDQETVALRNAGMLDAKQLELRDDQFQLRTEQFVKCKKQTKKQKRWGIARQTLTHSVAALAGAGVYAWAQ